MPLATHVPPPAPLPPGAEGVDLLILDADGVLTDGFIWVDDTGRQMRRYSVRDGLAIGAWQRLGFRIAIISGRRGDDLEARAAALGVDEVVQGVEDKAEATRELLRRLDVEPARAAFLGDDVQDLPAMGVVGLPMAVADAEPAVLAAAAWVTARPGGAGAVRDAIDGLIRARGLTERAMALMTHPKAAGRISAALILAIVVAVIFAGLVAYFTLRPGRDGFRRDDIHQSTPPEIEQGVGLGGIVQAEIPFTGDDPERLAGKILFDRSNPADEPRTYDIDAPQAFIYLENGQTLHVQGESGRFVMATRDSPPEQGAIRGNVLIRLFDPVEDGSELDITTAAPVLTARTSVLHFDTDRGELTNDERITVESPRLHFVASGINARFDRISQRLLKLEFARGERLTYFPPPQTAAAPADPPAEASPPPRAAPGAGRPAAKPASPPAPAAPPATAQAPSPPDETLYHAIFKDDVVVEQEARRLTADQLDIWTRLLDNRLPEGAIGQKNLPATNVAAARPLPPVKAPTSEQVGGAGMEAQGGRRPLRAAVGGTGERLSTARTPLAPLTAAIAAAVAQTGPAPDAQPAPAGPITLTWTGLLVVNPITGDTPVQLAKGNHVAIEFTANRTGQVRFADESLGARGYCQSLAYRATDQVLTLWGIGERSGAAFRSPGMGEMRAGRIIMDIATLMATIPGSGRLIALGETEDAGAPAADAPGVPSGEIMWGSSAGFQFRSRPRAGGRPDTIAIETASFSGNVEAKTGDGAIWAESLRAEFGPPHESDAGDEPRLRHLIARREADPTTRVVARASGEGAIECNALDVWFDDADASDEADATGATRARARPTRLLATGDVEATTPDAVLEAQTLDAVLAADSRGRSRVVKADLAGAVILNGRDADGLPVRARADEITAWPEDDRAVLVGGVGVPARVARDGTEIEAPQLELDGRAGVVNAFGPGSLAHEIDDPRRDRRGDVAATWTEQMLLNDETGEADLYGDVVATVTRAMQEDKLAAEQVTIRFTPRSEVSAEDKAAAAGRGLAIGAPGDNQPSTRRFLGAIAIGAILAGDTSKLATIGSGQWVADGAAVGGRRLVSLLWLQGPRIDADAESGALDVDGAGRLVLLDHRSREEPSAGELAAAPAGSNGVHGAGDDAGDDAGDAPGPLDPAALAHGETLIDWQGALHMDRAGGRLDIRRAVQLSHKPAPDEAQMNLDCERLEAVVRETGGAREATAFQGELIRAEAFGAVWAQSGLRELVAERLTYNAITRDVEATAPGSIVIFHDGQRGATATASRLLWNLATDHIRIEDPGTVTAPAPERAATGGR